VSADPATVAGPVHVVATAGHVDHGKSTLLRALTGMEPDRWEEERRRGLTIDLGFVWTRLAGPGDDPLTVAFVDVPGHERFVANMLAGAGGVRLALFVVAADDGWSAQSQEHLDILDLLGVGAAVAAVTKADVAGDARAAEVAGDVERRLAASPLAGAPVVVVDGVSGRGVGDLGRVLAARLATTTPPPDEGRPRLWVDRSFTVAGAGTVVTGTLAGGSLRAGDEVALLPQARPVRIRGLQALGRAVAAAAPGTRVAVNLAGVERGEVARGDAVVGVAGGSGRAALDAWRATRWLDGWVRALPGHEIDRTGAWHLHAGSADRVVSVHPLLGEPVRPGGPAHVRLHLDDPLPLRSGDRFVLREAGRKATLGGGEVLDPDPPGRVRGPDARLERAAALDTVRDAAPGGPRLTALVAAAGGARPAGRAAAAAGVTGGGELDPVGGYLVDRGRLGRWAAAVQDAARRRHAADPDRPGAGRQELAEAARAAGCPEQLAGAVVDTLAEQGRLHRDGSAFTLPEHAAAREAAKARRRERLLALLAAEPFQPPPLDAAASEAGMGHEELHALAQRGDVVVCGQVAFAREAVDLAVQRLRDLQARSGRFTTAAAREALGTSRKYAIPLLEHLDAAGVTDFDGRTRGVRTPG
jgi:selenocysteine-specific elongation factor